LGVCIFAYCGEAAGFSVCAVGDSITEGGAKFVAHRVALEREFAALGWNVEWKGSHVKADSGSSNLCEGFSGNSAEQIAAKYEIHAADIAADVLLLHAGHNYNGGDPNLTPSVMPVEDIVASATNAHARIIVAARAQNPDVIVLYAQVISSGGNREQKYAYITNGLNQAIATLGAQLNTPASPVVVVDMADGWNYATDCVSDCVHPNASGAAKMAAKWMTVLNALVAAGKLKVDIAKPYERLAYIASPENNASVIDTGWTPRLTDRVETKIRLGSLGANQGIFSARQTSTTNTFTCVLHSSKLRFDHHTTNPYVYHRADGASADTAYTADNDYEIVMDGGTCVFSVNGATSATRLAANPADPEATPGITMRFFAVATKGSGHTLFAKGCRMYYFRAYDKDDTILLDFVPMRRRSDGKVGFYDRVGKAFKTFLSGDAIAGPVLADDVVESCLVEAEAFTDKGGWVVDPQFVEQMGSPYLLAHGKGIPVADATTFVNLAPGRVRAWVRTRDWTPDWDGEKPGRFQLALGGQTFPNTLGVAPATWGWVDAGVVEVGSGPHVLALHDLTGFEGRCDAVYLCPEATSMPPSDAAALAAWRAEMRGEAGVPDDVVQVDFVVVGGGMAGTAAAIAAADAGLNVAIVQDRPVLGGNASDEIRVLSCRRGDECHWIVNEIKNGNPNNTYPSAVYDEKRMALARSYPNLGLHLGWRAYGVVTNAERKIVAVDARNVETGARRRFVAPLYCDATGDGWIAYWAGAAYMLGREAKDEYNEPNYATETANTSTMGNSLLWTTKMQDEDYVFPEVPWAVAVSGSRANTAGDWHWETGLDPAEDTIDDAEMLRDRLFRAIYGNFYNAKQKSGNEKRVFDWVPHIAGKRESRRIIGDYVVSEGDVLEQKQFEDAIGIATWGLDRHKPSAISYIANNDNKDVAAWWMPYRALCCRDVSNLFLAGRCASFTHVAFSSSRVQNACAQQGVAVGYAASLCKKYGCLPRGIYQDAAKTAELQARMNVGQADKSMELYLWPDVAHVEVVHAEVIVDNADETGVEISGNWVESSSSLDRFGANYLHNDKKSAEDLWVKFTPDIPSNATYDVSFYFNGNSGRGSAIPVEIVYDGGVVTNYIDQSFRRRSRVSAGSFPFAKGTSGYVRLMTLGQSGKYVIADAVRFALVEKLDVPPDSDGNGLYDAWERTHFLRMTGTDPAADPDGDGQSNRYEYVVGSDPNIVNRPFAIEGIESMGSDSIALAWKGVAGRVYQVKRATEVNGNYSNYGEPVAADEDGICSVEVPISDTAAFFMIEVSVES
jgi:lysophospholipase L1-like esterase